MQLIELNPRWVVENYNRSGMGLSFDCPVCKRQRLSIWYANPIDGGAPYPLEPITEAMSEEAKKFITARNNRWQRSGDSFESLTLLPSIDASAAGHWHGFITKGQISGDTGPCKAQS